MSERRIEHRSRPVRNTFRAFLALDVNDETRQELARIAAQLKSSCRGSFPAPELYHMTVAFLGDITPAQGDGICAVLESSLSDFTPFDLTLCRLGYFNQSDSATVFCSTERNNTLLSLAQRVYRSAWDCHIPFDAKQFRAHITLGRRVDLSTTRLDSVQVNHVSFPVCGVTLYKSILRPCGPSYEAIDKVSFPL